MSEEDITNAEEVLAYTRALEAARAEKSAEPPVIRGKVNFAASLGRFNNGEKIANFSSPVSNQKITATRSLKFATYPKYLMIQSRRFTIGENWQPKKLNVDLEFPEKLDLETLRAKGRQPGELEVSNSEGNRLPQIDEGKVNELVDMGYPYHAARKAVYHSGGEPNVSLN